MEILKFNRHENMSSETQKLIRETINDVALCNIDDRNTSVIENWLFGSFDGHDYSEYAIKSRELASITEEDPALGAKITEIFNLIKTYPTV